jgi:tetratricopeptide (TPR) repeat protein
MAQEQAPTQVLDAMLRLALQHFQQRRWAEAEAVYRRALEIAPTHADALNMLGVVCAERGNPLLALKYIDAIRVAPLNAAYLTNRGELLRRWGLADEGLTFCRRAAELDPTSPEARNNLGLALLGKGGWEEAIPHIQAALDLRPDMMQARINLGRAHKGLRQWEQAEQVFREAVAVGPGSADAWYELATVQERLDDSRVSVESCQRALECRAEFPEALVALGDAWTSLGLIDGACNAYRRALQVSPAYTVARYQLALALLGRGEFAEGWQLYESRFDPTMPERVTPPMLPMPMWQGEPLEGRSLLVITEQGYGDHVQFARFVPLLAQRGARIVMGASPEMLDLTATLEGITRVVTHMVDAWNSGCDYWMFVGSLPLRLAVEADRLSASVPYLRADPERAAAWRERLSVHDGALKVGLGWAGRPTHSNDWRRSIPFEKLAPLGAVRDAVFVSLQTGERARDPADAGGLRVIECGDDLRNFADTAALISELDLLISVDTAPAHVAGALGRPVWTLLPFQPDWRWRLDAGTSRWYPTMRLIRQQRNGDWDELIARVVTDLTRLAERVKQ